jgi:RHS repeat-associated protein
MNSKFPGNKTAILFFLFLTGFSVTTFGAVPNAVISSVAPNNGVLEGRVQSSGSDSTLSNGLIGHWDLDESSGDIVDGLGITNGTVTGTPTYGVAGKQGTAMYFNKSHPDYITMGTTSQLRPTDGLTVSFFMKTTTGGTTPIGNFIAGSPAYGFSVQVSAGGVILFKIADGTGNHIGYYTGTISVVTGLWVHVLAKFDGTYMKLYINNVLDGSPYPFNYPIVYDTGNIFQIANRANIAPFTGTLDIVDIFDRGVTDSERAELYNSGAGRIFNLVAPTASAATNKTATSFSANWGAVAGATGYRLDVSTNSSFSSFVTGYNNLTVATTSSSVTGLAANTTYYYRVRATNASVTSASSNIITSTTLLLAPVSNTATNIASTSLTANWGTVSGATEYRFDLSVSNTFSSFVTGYNDLQVITNTRDIAGLTAGTTYYYRVRAKNANVTSANSNMITTLTHTATQGYNTNYFVPQYNGNISAIRWRSTGGSGDQANSIKEYDYRYDAINRLNRAQYQNLTDTSFNSSYNEDNITYDLNGNINSLRRKGATNSGILKTIDNLAYTYDGNKLLTVTDAEDKSFGFIDVLSENDYLYDANGNMQTDNNKGFTIKYNLLNLPCKISKGNDSIVYIYDAAGTKLSKKVYLGGVLNTTIDYCGETEFYNGVLKYLHTEEGVVENVSGSFTYEYFLKDHLGNTRAVVSSDLTGNLVVGQVNSYYAFGMEHTGIPVISNPGSDNKYAYNGKEKQSESLGGVAVDWYDYGARFYDAQIGRFTTIDPLAEEYDNQSSYLYAHNNPVRFTDYLGMGAEDEVDKDKDKKKKDEEAKKKEEEKKKEDEKKAEEAKKKKEKKEEFKFKLSEEDEEAILDLIQGGGALKKVGKEVIIGVEAAKLLIIARKLKLNISSSTTKEIIKNLDQTVESFISKYRKGSIKSEFPAEFLDQTVEKALKSGNTTVRKLLTDKRFMK